MTDDQSKKQEQASASLNQFFKNLYELKQYIKSRKDIPELGNELQIIYDKFDAIFREPIEVKDE